jgi:hypothetical protein
LKGNIIITPQVVIYPACNNLTCNKITLKIAIKFKQKMEKKKPQNKESYCFSPLVGIIPCNKIIVY